LSEIESGGAKVLSYNLQIDMQGGGSGPWINAQGYIENDIRL